MLRALWDNVRQYSCYEVSIYIGKRRKMKSCQSNKYRATGALLFRMYLIFINSLITNITYFCGRWLFGLFFRRSLRWGCFSFNAIIRDGWFAFIVAGIAFLQSFLRYSTGLLLVFKGIMILHISLDTFNLKV